MPGDQSPLESPIRGYEDSVAAYGAQRAAGVVVAVAEADCDVFVQLHDERGPEPSGKPRRPILLVLESSAAAEIEAQRARQLCVEAGVEQVALVKNRVEKTQIDVVCQGRSKTRPLRRRESRPIQGWWKL